MLSTDTAENQETELDHHQLDEIIVIEKDGGMSCAICLIDYEEGDIISCSHNPACQHFFHRACILSWLRSHDLCPCCRQDYLSFGDDNGGKEDPKGTRNEQITRDESANIRPNDDETRNPQLDRLYGMEDLESNTPTIGLELESSAEPWDVRLERNMERLRRQVEDRVQAARNQIRERRENHRRNREEQDDDDDDEEGRLEQSIQLLRSQLARVREAANREIQNRRNRDSNNGSRTAPSRSRINRTRGHEDHRFDDAIQVVRSRLEDIANSGTANRLREQSTRTVQNLMKHASKLRK